MLRTRQPKRRGVALFLGLGSILPVMTVGGCSASPEAGAFGSASYGGSGGGWSGDEDAMPTSGGSSQGSADGSDAGDLGSESGAGEAESGGAGATSGGAGEGADGAGEADTGSGSDSTTSDSGSGASSSTSGDGASTSDGGGSGDAGCTRGALGCSCDLGSCEADAMCVTGQCVPLTTDPCGFPEDGVWIEIDYDGRFSVYSPTWRFSNTAGWTASDWANNQNTDPEIHAFQANMNTTDPWGDVAEFSGAGWIRMMIGIGGIVDYDSATVCVHGRGVSTSSSTTVALENPLVGCGATVQLSNAWWNDPQGVTLPDGCIVPDNEFQALQIGHGGGAATGVGRVRLTLHGAVY